MKPPRVLPLGDAAVTVELGEDLDPATSARVRALDRALLSAPFDGLRETAPALRSLLVLYDPAALGFAALRRELLSRAAEAVAVAGPVRRHQIPTRYGGEDGEDLEPLARSLAIAPAELVRRHASIDYTALMLGFTPGFPYLGLLPGGLVVPRLATPRVRVPAGSVGLAGRMTGAYPVASPGGWQIVGRISWRLFDPLRQEPARIAPGDRVRFVPTEELPDPEPAVTPPLPAGDAPVLEVIDPGLLTSVQDGGRTGWRRYGVASAGAADPHALACANRAVGNPPAAAGLECTLLGPILRFLRPWRFAVAGADLGAVLERADLGSWPVPLGAAVLARPGNLLRFRGRVCGCRAVIALAGGLRVPAVLGSRSTDLQSGFGGHGGRALRAGDTLGASDLPTSEPRGSPAEARPDRVTLRVVLGPQADQFDAETVRRFLSTAWRLRETSDRVGCRLDGPQLAHRRSAEILSDGMVPGSVQVPPDGRPILMLADAPTTGGYPKLATVVGADLPRAAQLVPGSGEVRFEAVAVEEVQR